MNNRWAAPMTWSDMVEDAQGYLLHDYFDDKIPPEISGNDPMDLNKDVLGYGTLEECIGYSGLTLAFSDETTFTMGDMAFTFCRNLDPFGKLGVLPVGSMNREYKDFDKITPTNETFAWMMLWQYFDDRFHNRTLLNWTTTLVAAGVSFDIAVPFAVAGIEKAEDVIRYTKEDIDVELAASTNA